MKIRGEPGIETWLHMLAMLSQRFRSKMGRRMETQKIYQTAREPKILELEKTDDGRYRLVITVKKLGATTAVEYFLDQAESYQLSQALTK
jgi:hypothetical protein